MLIVDIDKFFHVLCSAFMLSFVGSQSYEILVVYENRIQNFTFMYKLSRKIHTSFLFIGNETNQIKRSWLITYTTHFFFLNFPFFFTLSIKWYICYFTLLNNNIHYLMKGTQNRISNLFSDYRLIKLTQDLLLPNYTVNTKVNRTWEKKLYLKLNKWQF